MLDNGTIALGALPVSTSEANPQLH